MHTNIPTNELMDIINLALNNNYTGSCVKWKSQKVLVLHLMTFIFIIKENTIYKKQAMGAPNS